MKILPLTIFALMLSSTALAQTKQQQVEALFAKWDRTDAPGAAVAVVQDGKVVYRRGFGMADIEQARPMSPATPVHTASLSKQFTAFAVLLLAQQGKLSLDDDVRKHLPDVPDFGKPILIRHLLNHTSGLRDQLNLLALAGWRMDDVITEEDIMQLVRRQRALNFAPGSDFAYNNTGYTLLAAIVQRVSGKSLAAYAKENIFQPLGMKNTFFHERYSNLVARRANSYEPGPNGGYASVALSFSYVGPTSLFSTADDLLLWDKNFDDARVGGKALLALMQTPGKLNDGTVLDYAQGLTVGAYRGLRTVDHRGSDAGFRSHLLRFPEQHLTIAVIANGADVQAGRLGQRIADIYLGDKLAALPKPVPNYSDSVPATLQLAQLDALVGGYALENGSAIAFSKESGGLRGWTAGDDPMFFYPAGEREYFAKLVNGSFVFDQPGPDGVVAGGTWRRNTRSVRGKRIEPVKLSEAERKALEGEYYSDELHVLYTVEAKGGDVVLRHPRGDVALLPFGKNSFVGPWPFGLLKFECDAPTACSGFSATEDRARYVQFVKASVVGGK
ncbi:serine hydrolase domain-containing protein [Massilia sp. SR12]